jgi:hypothetical protein
MQSVKSWNMCLVQPPPLSAVSNRQATPSTPACAHAYCCHNSRQRKRGYGGPARASVRFIDPGAHEYEIVVGIIAILVHGDPVSFSARFEQIVFHHWGHRVVETRRRLRAVTAPQWSHPRLEDVPATCGRKKSACVPWGSLSADSGCR